MSSNTTETIQVAVPVPKPLQRRMRLYCVAEDITVREFVCRAIEELLDKVEKKKW